MNSSYKILLSSYRGNVQDYCYYGGYCLAKKGKIYKEYGIKKDSLFFMRSLAKPLQASILLDSDIINDYNILPHEIAIMSGSHSGSIKHTFVLKNLLKKHKLKISDLQIKPIPPLDKRNYFNHPSKLHNNCSGKHIMMLLMSKYNGFSLENYSDINHPVQKLINKKQVELSGFNSSNYSFDGCGTPLWEINLEGIIRAYHNLVNYEKYSYLINSILKNPDIFGGYDRLDSDIITLSKGKLFAKVGASGFILVYNINLDECLFLKMAQDNNYYRKLITFDILNKLNWLDVDVAQSISNQKNVPVAKYCYEFKV